MALWMLSFFIIAVEVWGSLYFFDIFMETKKVDRLIKNRYWLYFLMIALVSYVGQWLSMWKCFLNILVCVILCMKFYRIQWKQGIFFSVLNYCMLFLTDFIVYSMEKMWIKPDSYVSLKGILMLSFAKILWLIILLVIHKIWKNKVNYRELTNKEWLKFSIIPIFTLVALLVMFFHSSEIKTIQIIYMFLAVGLVCINFVVIYLLQEILEKEEMIRVGILAGQKERNQLVAYHDMQTVYERQRRMIHDYKNQLGTLQTLLKGEDIQAALALLEKLTTNISVDMSAVNTNHPVVNAVLNQKFHSAQEKRISLLFKIGDLQEIKLDEEEIVILLSNLLDNAIRECEKVMQAKGKAVIHLKLVYENEKVIFSVKNPVLEKVEIVDNMVQKVSGGIHGIGLTNVKTVVDKYDGELVLFCDDKEFQAVVML